MNLLFKLNKTFLSLYNYYSTFLADEIIQRCPRMWNWIYFGI